MGPYQNEWEPVPLELPLADPYGRTPAQEQGEQKPDPSDDVGRHVIVIDLT